MAAKPTLARLRIYPVKALGGIDVTEWELDEFGLRLDRRWMVVDPSGRFMTQREHPRLAAVSVEIDDGQLVLSAAGRGPVDVPLEPDHGRTEPVVVWKDTVAARAVSDDADRWLSEYLRTSCQLVYMPDSTVRPLDPEHAAGRSQLSFVDAFPLLLIGSESLDELNRRLEEPVPMERFRPNLVVDGTGRPHAEDRWRSIRVGGVELRLATPCSRCAVTTTDQRTGERGKEPLATLATYRSFDGKVYFGQNVVHAGAATLKVGDRVDVLEQGEARPGPGDDDPATPEVEAAPGEAPARRGPRAILRALVGLGEPRKADDPRSAASDAEDGLDLTLPESGASSRTLLPDETLEEPLDDEALDLTLDEKEARRRAAERKKAAETKAAERKAAEKAAAEREAAEKAAAEKAAAEKKAAEKRAAEKRAAEKKAAEKKAAEKKAAEKAAEKKVEEKVEEEAAAVAEEAPPKAKKKAAEREPRPVEVRTGRIPTVEEVVRLLDAAAVADSRSDLENLAEACVKAEILLTAWRGDDLVGLLRGWTDAVRDGFLSDVAVHPDHHGLGIPEALVRRAVAFHPEVRWVLRAFAGSVYLGDALGWQHVGSGWYVSPR